MLGRGHNLTVVDFHVHVGRCQDWHPWVREWMTRVAGEDLESRLEKSETPTAFVQFLDEAGVGYAVVLAEYSPITTGVVPNEYVAEFCAGEPRLIPFASINPYLVGQPGRELERCVRELGCRGLKLYPTYQYFYPNDRVLYPVYSKAEELGIPVMFHTGSSVFRGARLKYGDPIYFDDVAVDFPDMVIVQAHSGRGYWYDAAFTMARFHENVYMEISGLPPKKLLSYFPDFEKNADKIIFGSDWPGAPDITGNIEMVRHLPISAGAQAKILGENAARILKL